MTPIADITPDDAPVIRNRHLAKRDAIVAGLSAASEALWECRAIDAAPDAYSLGVIDRAIADLRELDARGLIGGFDV